MGGRDEPLTRPKVISHARDPPCCLKPCKQGKRAKRARSAGEAADKFGGFSGVCVRRRVSPFDDLLL